MSVGPPPSASPAEPALPDRVYLSMARLLRTGLIVSVVLLVASLAALLVRSHAAASGPWVSSNPVGKYLGLGDLARGLVAGTPEAYLTIGVLALIATPVLRVASGTVAFLRHGDRKLGEITLVVLALLLLGLFVLGPWVH